jgi:hypothetical protein
MTYVEPIETADNSQTVTLPSTPARTASSSLRLNPVTAVLTAQLACFLVRTVAGRFTNHIEWFAHAGLLLGALGVAVAVYVYRMGDRTRGMHCGVATATMLFFWRLQLLFAQDPMLQ